MGGRLKQEERKARLVWFCEGVMEDDGEGPNLEAATALVATLRELGGIKPTDEATVRLFLMLATAVDGDPTNGGLWNQYRQADIAVKAMQPATSKGSKIDELRERRDANAVARRSGAADSAPAGRRAQPRRSAGSHRTS